MRFETELSTFLALIEGPAKEAMNGTGRLSVKGDDLFAQGWSMGTLLVMAGWIPLKDLRAVEEAGGTNVLLDFSTLHKRLSAVRTAKDSAVKVTVDTTRLACITVEVDGVVINQPLISEDKPDFQMDNILRLWDGSSKDGKTYKTVSIPTGMGDNAVQSIIAPILTTFEWVRFELQKDGRITARGGSGHNMVQIPLGNLSSPQEVAWAIYKCDFINGILRPMEGGEMRFGDQKPALTRWTVGPVTRFGFLVPKIREEEDA